MKRRAFPPSLPLPPQKPRLGEAGEEEALHRLLRLPVRLGHQVGGAGLGPLGEALFQVVEVDAPGEARRLQGRLQVRVVGVAPSDHPSILREARRAKRARSFSALFTPGASSTPLARSRA